MWSPPAYGATCFFAMPYLWESLLDMEAGWPHQNASHYDYADDPTVALDERGDIAVAWDEQGRKDVFFQRLAHGSKRHDLPVNVSRSPATFSWLPRIALRRQDRVVFAKQPLGGPAPVLD